MNGDLNLERDLTRMVAGAVLAIMDDVETTTSEQGLWWPMLRARLLNASGKPIKRERDDSVEQMTAELEQAINDDEQ